MKFSNYFSRERGFPSREERHRKSRLLSVTLLIWTLCAALVPNTWLSLVDGLPVVPALTNVVLPAGIYLMLLSLSRRIGVSSLWFVILYVFAAFQIVLLYMYGRSIIAVDMFLNVVTTNSTEIGELLGNMKRILTVIFLIYLPPIIMAIIAIVGKLKLNYTYLHRARVCSGVLTLIGLILLGVCYLQQGERIYHIYCDLYPVNIGYNLREAVVRTSKVARYKESVKNIEYPSEASHPDSIAETYVVVIGETSRSAHWQLNGYERPTSPRLMNEQGLANFPKALTQSNTTHKSVPMLMSHLDASTYGDSIYHVKSLITAFRNAGFHTAFFTAQSRNHSFIDFFGEEADTCVFVRDIISPDSHFYDTELLEYVDKALASGHRKQLIVLHTYGSHFNYTDRYPSEKSKFIPDSPIESSPEFRDKLINAYDNTILLTSEMLASLIDRLKGMDGISAMIYTSDHGEDIFDDSRKLFLHASPQPSYYQIHVPFMVWLNRSYISMFEDKYDALKRNENEFVASSDALYHTLIDIAGVRTPLLKESHSLSSNFYEAMEPIYLNDHNKRVALRKSGLLKPDFEKLDSVGVDY